MTALDDLGRRLGDAVERQSEERAVLPQKARRVGRIPSRSRLALGAVAVSLLTVLGLLRLVLSGTADRAVAATLPALRHADRDLRRVPGLPSDIRRTMDLERAYAFSTAAGTGYVVASPDRRRICVLVPRRTAGYGATCAGIGVVERHGLVSGLVRVKASDQPVVVIVLPDGAPAPTIRYADGTIRRLSVRNGVATARLEADGFLRVVARGNVRDLTVRRTKAPTRPHRG